MDPISSEQSLAEHAQREAEALFGAGAAHAQGVTHVCAAVRAQDGRLRVLTIHPGSPKSEHDFFALNLARARADALLTSAENLRREQSLSHALAGPHHAALETLRHVLGKAGPPHCAILTRTGDLPLEHPAWDDGTPKLVLTHPPTASELARRLGPRAEVIGLRELTPRRALSWLQTQFRDVSIEAGPRTSGSLYDAPAMIDELLLSRFHAPELNEPDLGGALPEDERLFSDLVCVHESERFEPSGRWTFQRWLRVGRP